MNCRSGMDAMTRWSRLVIASGLVVSIAACGGSGDAGQATTPPVVASVMIRESGLLLQQPGDNRQLSAVAKDSQGNELDVPIAWSSGRPAAISVDGAGRVIAVSASGSSQIVATAQGLKSAPLLAVVMQPAAGTVLVSDAQVSGEPVETDPNAAPSFTNTYRVTLSGVAAPALGALLVGTGSKAVAGRVVAADTSIAGQTTVTLALAPLREIFPNLQIDEEIDLSQSAVTYPDAVRAAYTVERVGNTFTFTPKPASARGTSREQALANAVGTRVLGPFSCEDRTITGVLGNPPPLPVQMTTPPLISVTIGPSLDLRYTPATGLERFVVKAEPTLKVASELTATIAFEGKLSCKLELFVIPIPIGGALSLALSGLVPVGAGFELGGKLTLGSVKFTSNVEAKANAEIGLVCPGGTDCALHTLLDPALKFDPTLTLPSAGLSGLRFEPALEIFGTVDAVIGNRFLRSLRWEVLKTKFGGKLAGNFATQAAQIADAGYKSDYKLSLEAKAGVGSDLNEALGALGLTSLTVVERPISTDIATSPAATVTTDRATFSVGDTVNLKAVLDPVTFLSLYNVNKVVWVRDSGGIRTTLGTQVASSGQTEFNFPFVADADSDGNYYAFVITALPLDFLQLELGQVAVGGVSIAPPPPPTSPPPLPAGACPFYKVTTPEETGSINYWGGIALNSPSGSGKIGYTNVGGVEPHVGAVSIESTFYMRVETYSSTADSVTFPMTWVGNALIEAGSVSASLSVNGISASDGRSSTGPLVLTVPVTIRPNDLIKVTFSATGVSPDIGKVTNFGGELIEFKPVGASLSVVTCL